ncbi:hypothetical protein PMI32_05949 [Pseudomonas sp. GM60]|nr:hypothetical protein PMI32_05949 [Pseudomonas sp. GM60]
MFFLQGTRLLAMAVSWTPSPASRLLQGGGEPDILSRAPIRRSQLAGDGDFTDAIASKLAPTGGR